MLDEETKARKERMKDYKRRYREKHGLKVHEHRWRNVLLTICAVAIVGTGSFFAAQSKAAQLVTLDGMSAVDLTDEDVNRYLDEREDGLSQKTIALKEDGMDEKISLKDVKAHFDREKIKENLFLVGRVGTPLQRISDVISTLRFGKDVPLSIAVDDDSLNTEVSRIHDTYDTDPENAYVTPNQDGTVRIHKERSKITIDTAGTMDAIHTELGKGTTNDVSPIITSRQDALIKEGDLKDIDTVLSYYTTHFDGVNPNRDANIEIAQKKLSHTLVLAGKECSFNETVGRRTRDKGYKDAPVYFDNKLVLDAGGGVCQVSTTLFNAALRAGMIIGSRAPHYAPAGYVPVGMDATVADDSLDFSFTNPFNHPVYIYTEMGDASVTVYILGNHKDTCQVSFETLSQRTLPHRVVHKHDDSVTEDKRDQEGYDGHEISIRRTVHYTDGDSYTDTITSHYDPNSEIILTPGPDSDETVQTTNLDGEHPQDAMLNSPHDPLHIPPDILAKYEAIDNAVLTSASDGDGEE
ncbi:MAG: VanW family protein [Caecibacter sp.]|nr:VanW family protein [Caecibacter sp.]